MAWRKGDYVGTFFNVVAGVQVLPTIDNGCGAQGAEGRV